jgi:hypothetical protein
MRTKPKTKPAQATSQPEPVAQPLTTSNSAAHVGTHIGPVMVDGFKHLSPFDLVRYELAQMKIVAALQAVGLKKAESDQIRRDFESRMRDVQHDVGVLQGELKSLETTLRVLQEELAQLYGLDFAQVTYDDVSGRIYLPGDQVSS